MKATSKEEKILLLDLDLPETRPLARFRSVFSLRNGIYSETARLRKEHPKAIIFYYHPDAFYEKSICAMEQLYSLREVYAAGKDDVSAEDYTGEFVKILPSDASPLFGFLPRLPSRIEHDLRIWYKKKKIQKQSKLASGLECIGPADRLFVHQSAQLLAGVILDTSEGLIVIDRDARIAPFSYLKGPLYIGKGARLDQARIGSSIVGREVRLGGEVENSIIQDFSNKHHDGFLGHSLVGSWVNFGALATTSDLKNNYGRVRLKLPRERLPKEAPAFHEMDTGTIKFGSIVGDCVKIAIGTMLNTGSVLDAGSNVFGGSPPKYLKPLSWGLAGERYDPERFWQDTQKIFGRRNRRPHPVMKGLLQELLDSGEP